MIENTEQQQQVLKGFFTTDKKTLTQIAKTIKSLDIQETTLIFDVRGLSMRSMDSSHVELIDMGLPDSIFEKFDIQGELKIGLDVENFVKFVSNLDSKGSISFEVTKEKITVSQNGFISNFDNIEIEPYNAPLPRIPYNSIIEFNEVSTKEFIQTIKKLDSLFDYIEFNTVDNSFEVTSKNDDTTISRKFESNSDIQIKNTEDSTTTYSLGYLMAFLKTLSKDSKLSIMYSSIKPLRLQTMINNLGRIDFYLAPRVEN